MERLQRFGVSIEKTLLESFDGFILAHGFHNRSEAIRDLIREKLSKEKGFKSGQTMGTVTTIYNHHSRGLSERLTALQHDYQKLVLFTSHVHITHEYCMEVIVVRGEEKTLRELSARIGGQRGVLMALPSFFSIALQDA
ncbi:MAG: nickel-responsive transcriptional regulator NikR [Spirochaetes bacterium]|nr:nickel-responsive transcriptional regulator NikR [Spirochaetota bacterium]